MQYVQSCDFTAYSSGATDPCKQFAYDTYIPCVRFLSRIHALVYTTPTRQLHLKHQCRMLPPRIKRNANAEVVKRERIAREPTRVHTFIAQWPSRSKAPAQKILEGKNKNRAPDIVLQCSHVSMFPNKNHQLKV